MKRISLLLASLAAIVLLSCGLNDNSNSSAEDVNYSQVSALQKASVDITPYATGSKTVTCSGSMSVYNVPYNAYAQSNEVSCNFTSLPQGSTIISIDLTSSIVIGAVGAFNINNFIIRCGNYTDNNIPWNGWAQTVSTSPTSPLVGKPANVICYASFYGKCNATGTGGVGCSHSRNNVTMTMY